MASGAGAWAKAEARLARAAQTLLSPSPDACEAAVAELEAIENVLRSLLAQPRAALPAAEQAKRFQASLRVVSGLWENAAAFRLGWARLLGAMTGGYTERGEARLPEPPATIALAG